MTREEIIKQINSTLAEEFEVSESEITPDANMQDTLSLDSLSIVDIVAMVHQAYNVSVPASELRAMKTFNDLYDYIEQHLPKE